MKRPKAPLWCGHPGEAAIKVLDRGGELSYCGVCSGELELVPVPEEEPPGAGAEEEESPASPNGGHLKLITG